MCKVDFQIITKKYLAALWYVKVHCSREGLSWSQLKDQWRMVQMVILSMGLRSLSLTQIVEGSYFAEQQSGIMYINLFKYKSLTFLNMKALKPGKLKEDSYHSKNNIHEPMFLEPLKDVRIRHVGSGSNAAHAVVVDESGMAWSWGNNEFGQLGQGDLRNRRIPTPIKGTGPGGHTIVIVSLGGRHTLLLTSQGQVLACGDNSAGQCAQGEMKTKSGKAQQSFLYIFHILFLLSVAVGKVNEEVETCSVQMVKKPTLINYIGPPVIKVSCGKEFSMMLDLEGCVWTFGSQEYGQCGNGTDGSYNSSSSGVGYWKDLLMRD